MEQELYHHGILGQRWGVRRYQNPDGSLTPAGKKRYNLTGLSSDVAQDKNEKVDKSSSKVKSEKGTQNFDKFKKQVQKEFPGRKLSDEDIYAIAKKEKNLKTIATITGGVVLAAGAGYALYKIKNSPAKDFDIPSGSILQRLTFNSEGDLNDVFYASIDDFDKKRYIYGLGINAQALGTNPRQQIREIGIGNNAHIAGFDTMHKIYDELTKTDSRFLGTTYEEVYNRIMLGVDSTGRKEAVKQAFLKNGYNGLIDPNDVGNGFIKPIIVFKDEVKAQEISRKNIADEYKKAKKVVALGEGKAIDLMAKNNFYKYNNVILKATAGYTTAITSMLAIGAAKAKQITNEYEQIKVKDISKEGA